MMTRKITKKEKNSSREVHFQTKIILAKTISKNWDKASKSQKKAIKKWWKENYEKFKKKN